MDYRHLLFPSVGMLLSLGLAGCGGGDSSPPPPPTAYDQEGDVSENTSISDTLDAADVDYGTSTFSIVSAASHGTITLNADTGDFIYDPDPGYLGADSFLWEVDDQWGVSNTAEYVVDVGGVFAQIHEDREVVACR